MVGFEWNKASPFGREVASVTNLGSHSERGGERNNRTNLASSFGRGGERSETERVIRSTPLRTSRKFEGHRNQLAAVFLTHRHWRVYPSSSPLHLLGCARLALSSLTLTIRFDTCTVRAATLRGRLFSLVSFTAEKLVRAANIVSLCTSFCCFNLT